MPLVRAAGAAAATGAAAALALLQAAPHPTLGRVLLVAVVAVGPRPLHSWHAAPLPLARQLLLPQQHMHGGACGRERGWRGRGASAGRGV